MDAHVQVIGTSHVEAIRRAASIGEVDVVNLDQDETLIGPAGGLTFTGPLAVLPDCVVLAIGGVAPSIYGLIEHVVPFAVGDAVAGRVPDGDRFFIPEQLMSDFLRQQQAARYKRISQCVERYSGHSFVVCLAPPPPRGESRDRGPLVKPGPYVRLETPGRFRAVIDNGFTPPALRKKLYDIDMQLLIAFCADLGVDVIGAPPAALDALGLLDETFSAGDPVHGNWKYGSLVIEQIRMHLARFGLSLATDPEGLHGTPVESAMIERTTTQADLS